MTTWLRPPGDPSWHSPSSVVFGGSTIVRCRGRWPSAMPGVEESENPPHPDRCDECVRVLVEIKCVERGLDELEEVTGERLPFDMTAADDVGGEGGF